MCIYQPWENLKFDEYQFLNNRNDYLRQIIFPERLRISVHTFDAIFNLKAKTYNAVTKFLEYVHGFSIFVTNVDRIATLRATIDLHCWNSVIIKMHAFNELFDTKL